MSAAAQWPSLGSLDFLPDHLISLDPPNPGGWGGGCGGADNAFLHPHELSRNTTLGAGAGGSSGGEAWESGSLPAGGWGFSRPWLLHLLFSGRVTPALDTRHHPHPQCPHGLPARLLAWGMKAQSPHPPGRWAGQRRAGPQCILPWLPGHPLDCGWWGPGRAGRVCLWLSCSTGCKLQWWPQRAAPSCNSH